MSMLGIHLWEKDNQTAYTIECFHSRDYRPYWFTETKESIYIKIEFNSQRFSLGHQHGRHFIVLEKTTWPP